MSRALVSVAAVLAAATSLRAQANAEIVRAQIDPAASVVAEIVADTDGDGRSDLLVVTRDGRVLRFAGADPAKLTAAGELQLRDPVHCLVACRDIAPEPGAELIVADPGGTYWLGWPAGDDAAPVHPLSRAARFTIRTDWPQASPFVQDLDRDGRLDLLIPTRDGCAPFRQEGGGQGAEPTFRALPPLRLPVQVESDESSGQLDDPHSGGLSVPRIETEDLDGDGRPDLLTRDGTRRAFHLQRAEGGFAPPIEVDLEQFVDSTPAAAMAPGSVAVLGDRQILERGDIDGDGIPDYVIAHRRKIWTFLASRAGPQFTKARTQAVADDTSGMLVVDLDEDGRADLLTFQVQIPTIGALLLGLVRSIDIDVKAVGYRSENGAFVNSPTWRRTVTLRVPPLLSLLGQQQELVERFVGILQKARPGVRGAFAAADGRDLALATADGTALELFVGAPDTSLSSAGGRRLLRELLFDDPNPVFDLERLFGLVAGLLDRRTASLTADHQALASVPLRDPAIWHLQDLVPADFDGNPGDELLLVYEGVGAPGRRAYDLLAWPKAAGR